MERVGDGINGEQRLHSPTAETGGVTKQTTTTRTLKHEAVCCLLKSDYRADSQWSSFGRVELSGPVKKGKNSVKLERLC
jgi:hypothetical protein